MSIRISKYIASIDCFDKSLIVLSVTAARISIASFATVIWAPVVIVSAIFSLAFSIFTGFVKKLLKTTRKKKKNHWKIVMLVGSKLNSIESKISGALIYSEISHEDFMTIIDEEKQYRELKESKYYNDAWSKKWYWKIWNNNLKKVKKQALMSLLSIMKLLIKV